MPEDTPQEIEDALEKDASRRQFITWLWRLPVIAALGGAGYAAWEVYSHLDKAKPTENPSFRATEKLELTSLATLEPLWSTFEFAVEGIPSIVIRVPDAIAGGLSIADKHFIAFSRICTHQGCIVKPNQNYEAIAMSYNYRTTSPVLACGCHFSIFDISKAGEAVSGPAIQPLPRINLEADAESLYAIGIEEAVV